MFQHTEAYKHLWKFLENKLDTVVITPDLLVQTAAEAALISDEDLATYATSSNITDADWAAEDAVLGDYPIDVYLVDSTDGKRFQGFNGPIKLAVAATTNGDGTAAFSPVSTTPSMTNGHYRILVTDALTWADDDYATVTISDPDSGVNYTFSDQTVKCIASGIA